MGRTYAVGLALVLGLAAPIFGCCKSSPDKVCSKMVDLSAKEGSPLPAAATTNCVKELEKMRDDEPEKWDCISKCSGKAETMAELKDCGDECDASGGKPKDKSPLSNPGGVPMTLDECKDMSLWVVKKRKDAGMYADKETYTAAGMKLFDDCVASPREGKWRCMRLSLTAEDIARCE